MKYVVLGFIITSQLFIPVAGQRLTAATASVTGTYHYASTSPEEVVRQFYDWYLHAHFPGPERQNLAKFRKYVTQRFLREQMAPDTDADLFLGDTSDPDEAWARGDFGVTTAAIQGQRATVQVTLRGGEVPTYRLRVTLRRERGAWKIDGVKRI